ncbi:NAD(P)-dependent alcohol dehydrogenase [Sphingobium sp. SJ10-10]|uniref:zinc-dependent alcohol dehydrogenase family protein n=1 Tax=Sphingobium sp. SJ10-10 TaxID=3114999 RepID=UPI002EAF6DA8|nr:NAD(P)-dependent alcohol dehydrogenase [Sphingobium sp. SJ10-10]
MRSLMVSPPWGLDNIDLVEAPTPEPGPGEVRVRMKAVSLNFRDLLIANGRHVRGALSVQPIIPFGDGCGIVDAVGDDVTRVALGDRVIPTIIPRWLAGPATPERIGAAVGMNLPGLGREYAVISQEALVKAPEFLTDAEAACLACAGLTAWNALFDGPNLLPGDVALLQGTGGVSMFALQFAKAAGFETIVTSSSDEKLERARAYGADHLINYRNDANWSAAARSLTGGRGPDFILDMGAPGTFEESLRAVRMNGFISVVGMLGAGSELNPATLLASAARVKAVAVGSRETFEAMCRAISYHRIRPVISEVLPWTEARRALESLESRLYFGKIVLEF